MLGPRGVEWTTWLCYGEGYSVDMAYVRGRGTVWIWLMLGGGVQCG